MNDQTRQFANVFFAVAQLFTNSPVFPTLFGLPNVGDLSDTYVTAFIPAGLTFAVWGPIYLGITAYAVYQALPGQREREIHRRVGPLALVAAVTNTLWTPLWLAQYVTASLVVIVVMLITLASIFVILRDMRGQLTRADQWCVAIPFSGYFAWINIATAANVTTMLMAWGWDGGGIPAPVYSAAVQLVAVAIASVMIIYSRGHAGTYAYTAVLVWAFVGVFLGNNA
ncbi:MAG: hypothetical protein AAF125_17330, partial [Chloroflexota bacterium]